MKQPMINFVKSEFVLCTAAVCAVISMFFVPPSISYLDYIDMRTLCLLFCLMSLVAGFGKCSLFRLLAQTLLVRQKELRGLFAVLILLPFFSSMFITNDVALITFVPFAILVLSMCGHQKKAPVLIVFQTIAANLGSMAMPFGNPQNLFLYANYSLSAFDFWGIVMPLAAVSLLCLLLCSFTVTFIRPAADAQPQDESLAGAFGIPECMPPIRRRTFIVKRDIISVSFTEKITLEHPGLCLMFAALFLLTLLSVFHIVPYGAATVTVLVFLLLFSRDLLKKVDYCLLITFVCFFVFAGNIGAIPAVKSTLSAIMEQNALLTSILASQVISNVPSAVLLSGFTHNWQDLLAGTNIGGLGTPIASMASLISLKLYLKSEHAEPGFYLAFFTVCNVIGLVLLTGFYLAIRSAF